MFLIMMGRLSAVFMTRIFERNERLYQALISRARLLERAFARHQNLAGLEDSALDWLAGVELNADRRRHLLERLQRPDYPNLASNIVDDLKHRDSKPFGSLEIHRRLLRDQLQQLVRLQPNLRNQTNFVNTYPSKIRPNPDQDAQREE